MKKIGFAAVSIPAMFVLATSIAIGGSIATAQAQTASTQPAAAPAKAQSTTPASEVAPTTPAKIHGHAQDPIYQPITNTKVEITTDGKTALYTFTTDAEGNYSGSGIKPGTYSVMLFGKINGKNGQPTQGIMDFQRNVTFAPGSNVEVNFDLSRESYVSQLPEATQKKIQEARKANAAAQQANVKIKNVNKLIQEARKERAAGNFDKAIALDTQATEGKPDVGLTWYELADSQLAAKKYPDASTNFQKALDIMAKDPKTSPEVIAAANNNLGEALARQGKITEAAAAYEAAAKAEPTKAGQYYQNEAITFFKKGEGEPALTAANKAIAINPNDSNVAVSYYIKGWALLQQANVDSKTGKIEPKAGTADAFKKYVEMQPNGPLSPDARSILKTLGH